MKHSFFSAENMLIGTLNEKHWEDKEVVLDMIDLLTENREKVKELWELLWVTTDWKEMGEIKMRIYFLLNRRVFDLKKPAKE